jgi:hypothetical protein
VSPPPSLVTHFVFWRSEKTVGGIIQLIQPTRGTRPRQLDAWPDPLWREAHPGEKRHPTLRYLFGARRGGGKRGLAAAPFPVSKLFMAFPVKESRDWLRMGRVPAASVISGRTLRSNRVRLTDQSLFVSGQMGRHGFRGSFHAMHETVFPRSEALCRSCTDSTKVAYY